MILHLHLARHGMTDFNLHGLIQGQLDTELNATGEWQAARLGHVFRRIPLDRIYTSDLARACQTARAVANEQQTINCVEIAPLLRERHWGSLQGVQWADDFVVPEDGESDEKLTVRLREWLKELIGCHTPLSTPTTSPNMMPIDGQSQSHANREAHVLAVTHQDCLLTILRILTEPTTQDSPLAMTIGPDVDLDKPCGNTAVAVVRVWWEGLGELRPMGRLESWGVGDHLD